MSGFFKWFRRFLWSAQTLTIIGLLCLNILTVSSFKVFDAVSGLLRMAATPFASFVDETPSARRPTWSEAVKKSEALETQNNKQQYQIDDLASRNKQQRKQIDDLHTRNKNLRNDIEVSQSRYKQSELELTRAKATHADEVADLASSNRKLTRKLATNSPTVPDSALRREVKDRTQKLMGRISRSTSIELASAPAELSSIGPGALVAAGLLAYEVRETCHQMKELGELYEMVSFSDDPSSENAEASKLCGLSKNDLLNFISQKSPEDLCRESRKKLQRIDVPGCQDLFDEQTSFEVNLDKDEDEEVIEAKDADFVVPLD